jgi:hypothetical protein
MSTIGYAVLSARRVAAPARMSASSQPGITTFADALAALVPAEALSLHAVILTATTKKTADGSVAITDAPALRAAFVALVLVTIGLYVGGRLRGGTPWERLDWLRAPIPPLAFVGWTLLQQPSAFDPVAPAALTSGMRVVIAVIAATVLGFVAAVLSKKTDASSPPERMAALGVAIQVQFRLTDGDPNWQLRGDVYRVASDVRVAKDVALRRAQDSGVIALAPGAYDYEFDANGGSGPFEISVVRLPSTLVKTAKLSGADTLDFDIV